MLTTTTKNHIDTQEGLNIQKGGGPIKSAQLSITTKQIYGDWLMGMAKASRREFLKVLGIAGGSFTFLSDHINPVKVFAADTLYPTKKIMWLAPVNPGSSTDILARVTSRYLPKHLREASYGAKGGEIVIQNRPESGGRRAYSANYYAKPDGYTIGDLNPFFIAESLDTPLDIDLRKYTFLARYCSSDRVLLTRAKEGFKSWEEMIKAGKIKEIKWGASSVGRGHHVASIFVKEALKIPARLINFDGAVKNGNALFRGDIDVAMMAEESSKSLIDSGSFRVLLKFAKTAHEYPGAKSLVDLGVPELSDICKLHQMVIAPPNLPKKINSILLQAFKSTFQDTEFINQTKQLGFEPDPIYGHDVQKVAFNVFKYVEDHAQTIKKYL